MDTVQIWKCGECGTQRQWGNANQPDYMNGSALLLCERACEGAGKHTPHSFVRVGVRRFDAAKQKYIIERVQ